MKHMKTHCASVLALLAIATNPGLVHAQAVRGSFPLMDVVGDWDPPGGGGFPGAVQQHEEVQDRGAGPDGGDFAGLPLNEAAIYRARAHSPQWLTATCNCNARYRMGKSG